MLSVAWYRFRATFHRHRPGLLAIVLLLGLVGGLAMAFCNFPSFLADPPAPSTRLAAEWKPYLEPCIEAFGPKRCMFESNFPVDLGSCDYATLWNAFKVFAKDYSPAEKTDLFAGTASRVYRLHLPQALH